MAAKKLGKKIEGTEVVFTFGEDEVRYDSAMLPPDMKDAFVPFGLGHKLGDSAASAKTTEEMKTAIDRVWNGLMESKWSTRTPGEAKEKKPAFSKKTILENLASLPEDQQEQAKALLASMGIIL